MEKSIKKISFDDFILSEYFGNYFTLTNDPKVRWLFIENTERVIFARKISNFRYEIARLGFILTNRTWRIKPRGVDNYNYYLSSKKNSI